MRVQRVARVMQRLGHGQVRVVQLHVFADQTDRHVARAVLDALDHLRPLGQVGRGQVKTELAAHDGGEIRFFQHQRRFVQAGQGDVFNHAVRLHVAEQRDFAEDGRFQRLVAAQHDDVRVDAHALQLLYGMLRGLGLMLVRATQEGYQRHMNKQAVLAPDFQRNLAHGL